MELNNSNYFSEEANNQYFSSTQYKAFAECSASALAQSKGLYQREKTDALLQGNYFDSFFDGTREAFEELHKDELFMKKGGMYAPFQKVVDVYNRVSSDKLFMKYASEGQQEIPMIGEISGIPFKIKIDSFHEGKAIVDRKLMANVDKVWSSDQKQYISFIESWGYDLTAAMYQEIVRQNTGLVLPFFLVIATKEKEPDIRLIQISQNVMDSGLEKVLQNIERFAMIKHGQAEAERCGKCAYCKSTKVLREIELYDV